MRVGCSLMFFLLYHFVGGFLIVLENIFGLIGENRYFIGEIYGLISENQKLIGENRTSISECL